MACNLVWQYQWFCFLYIFHLTEVWTGSGATFTAGNHTVMDMSMKHLQSLKHPCLASTFIFRFILAIYYRWPSGQPWLWRTTEIIVIHRLTDSESDESSSSPSSSTDKSPSNVFSILTWQRFRFSSQVARMFSFPSKESLCHVADAQLTRCKSPRILDSDARSMRSVYRKEWSHGLFIIYVTSLDPPFFLVEYWKMLSMGSEGLRDISPLQSNGQPGSINISIGV